MPKYSLFIQCKERIKRLQIAKRDLDLIIRSSRLWLFICCKTKLKKKYFFFEKIFVFFTKYALFGRKKCFYMEKKFYIEKFFY